MPATQVSAVAGHKPRTPLKDASGPWLVRERPALHGSGRTWLNRPSSTHVCRHYALPCTHDGKPVRVPADLSGGVLPSLDLL